MKKGFGEKLKELRKAAGLSQAEVSEKTGLDQSSISLWERGERDPNWTAVQKLALALGVNCQELIDDGVRLDGDEPEAAQKKGEEPDEKKQPGRKKKGSA